MRIAPVAQVIGQAAELELQVGIGIGQRQPGPGQALLGADAAKVRIVVAGG